MEVSPAKSLILSATIHGGSYFFIQPKIFHMINIYLSVDIMIHFRYS